MMVEELGIINSNESPLAGAVATFLSFAVFAFVPLIAYVLAQLIPALKPRSFEIACVLTSITLFALGALKVRITGRNWFRSGMEMFLVGGLAAAAAYGIGRALAGLA